MSSLKEAQQVVVAEVLRAGEALVIPSGMTLKQVRELIDRREKFEEEAVVLRETFDVFPFDGAFALDKVLTDLYGWSPAVATPGFFSDHPPQLISIQVGPGQVKQVPWGRFLLPHVDGNVNTSASRKSNRVVFEVVANVKRKHEDQVKRLFDALRVEIGLSSIYRGQAVKIRFRDDNGEPIPMPQPEFLYTDHIDESMLVYSDDVTAAIRTNLFTPIQRAKDCLANGIPMKRGVLLGGTYGTGKTLAASVASKYAVQHGITYVYVPRADELPDAIEFAKQYQSPLSIVFCEDIDRAISGERSEQMDDVLNTIDGIDSKNNNIVVVLTTNDLKAINPAMLRPGRLDAVIEVTPPDGPAVERLLRVYGGRMIRKEADLSEVGAELAGNIPAVIAEVVKRAKLAQLAIQEPGTPIIEITPTALLESAKTMSMQVGLLNKEVPKQTYTPLEDRLVQVMVAAIEDGNADRLKQTSRRVREIHEHIIN